MDGVTEEGEGAMGEEQRTAAEGHAAIATIREQKRERQRVMRELVTRQPISSQSEFVELLSARGFEVTQATVSRDIAELGLVKLSRDRRHLYALPEDVARETPPRDGPGPDESLRRILVDLPIEVRRSGLVLLLVSTPGTASVIAEAIDRSTFHEQEGTLAGDNTVLVLFADEERLERWRARIDALRSA